MTMETPKWLATNPKKRVRNEIMYKAVNPFGLSPHGLVPVVLRKAVAEVSE